MSEQTEAVSTPQSKDDSKLWCNFCGYVTEDPAEYLAHSCVEVLERQGKKIVPTGQNECR